MIVIYCVVFHLITSRVGLVQQVYFTVTPYPRRHWSVCVCVCVCQDVAVRLRSPPVTVKLELANVFVDPSTPA